MVERSTPGKVEVVEPAAVDKDQRVGACSRAEAAQIDGGPGAVHAAVERRQLDAGCLRNDFLHRLRRRTRDLFGGNDGSRCADDAVELPLRRRGARYRQRGCFAPARRIRLDGGRHIAHGATRGRFLIGDRFRAGAVFVERAYDDGGQRIRRNRLLRLAAEIPNEMIDARKMEASKQVRRRCAAWMVEDMGQTLGVTSVARHSEPSLTMVLAHPGEANVCTPRPTSSRVTTADGRSPGSRVDTLRRLPRTEIPSGL